MATRLQLLMSIATFTDFGKLKYKKSIVDEVI
jgi:hypothetical protein